MKYHEIERIMLKWQIKRERIVGGEPLNNFLIRWLRPAALLGDSSGELWQARANIIVYDDLEPLKRC